MSERKVLNKYYPPDYDPSKIPRAKRPKNRQWTIRTMAPFNMRCNTCGEYIYKGKKFNSRQELAEGETYLGLKVFRFYIKCPKCVSEITFKTDPENVDYALEAGATRNFEALRTAELMAEKEAKEKEEELANNPMKMLENRTKASQREMDMLETLEDLREMNSRHLKVDINEEIDKYRVYEEKLKQLQDEEDEKFIESVFGKNSDKVVKRIHDDDDSSDSDEGPAPSKVMKKPTDFLTQESAAAKSAPCTTANTSTASAAKETSISRSLKNPVVVKKSVGLLSNSKSALGMLVKKKQPASASTSTSSKESNKETITGRINGEKNTSGYDVGKDDSANHSAAKSLMGNQETVKTVQYDTQGSPFTHRNDSSKQGDCVSKQSAGPSSEGVSQLKGNSLSLLGSYSDSDSASEQSDT